MFILLLFFIITRPLICSVVFTELNLIYSISLSILLIGWIVHQHINLKIKSLLHLGLYLFLLGLMISTLIHPNPGQGFLYLGQYINGCLIFLVCQNLSKPRQEKLIFALIAIGTWICLLGFFQFLFGFQNIAEYIKTHPVEQDMAIDRFLQEKRIFTPFITPNTLGGFLIGLIPLAFTLKKHRWIIVLMCAALLLTQSIGAMTSLLIAVFLFFALKDKISQHFPWILASTLIILVTIILIRAHHAINWTQPLFSGSMRWGYWHETWQIIQNNPWTGVGLGQFDLAHSRYAHNSYLQIWAEGGLPALLGFSLFILAWVKLALQNIKNNLNNPQLLATFIATAVFLIHNLIDFTLLLPETGLIAAAIAGLAVNQQQSSPQAAA